MGQIRWTFEAVRCLEDIHAYISSDNCAAAGPRHAGRDLFHERRDPLVGEFLISRHDEIIDIRHVGKNFACATLPVHDDSPGIPAS